MKRMSIPIEILQSTQPTSGGAVMAVMAHCCANCIEHPPPAMGARFIVFGKADHAGWLALLLTKVGDVETNPGRQQHTNKYGFSISAINKYMVGSRYR